MNVCMIGCWYRDDIYSHNCYSLINELKKEDNVNLRFVTSNCNCFSSAQKYSIAEEELLNHECDVIKIPYAPLEPSKKYGMFKYYVVKLLKINIFLETLRGVTFFLKTRKCDVIHFDQVLRSFGVISFIVLLALSKLFGKKVIVTVHELDPLQEKYGMLNRFYNWADKLIVFSSDFREQLINLKMEASKIEVVPFCSDIGPLKDLQRGQFVYFGGHKLLKGKGFDALLGAIKIMESEGRDPKILVYTGEGCIGLEEGKKKVSDMGLDKYVTWSEFLYGAKLTEAYQKSIACLIPYTGGSGRHPVTAAMANATPVIATRKAGLPEYLGKLGIYINEESPQELADEMMKLLSNPDLVRSLGGELRKQAENMFGNNVIGKRTLKIYQGMYNAS